MLDISDTIAAFEWDLEEAKVLHLELSRLMNAEVAAMRAWGPALEIERDRRRRTCPVLQPMPIAG